MISLAVHSFLTGRPPRIKWLDKSLQYITSHKGVWLTTGGEIADWYRQDYFAEAVKEGESLGTELVNGVRLFNLDNP